jgi:hypothetical protein
MLSLHGYMLCLDVYVHTVCFNSVCCAHEEGEQNVEGYIFAAMHDDCVDAY